MQPGRDVRPALVLEEARDRQLGEVGIGPRRSPGTGRRRRRRAARAAASRARAGAPRARARRRPSASAMSERLGSRLATTGRSLPRTRAIAHGLAVMRDQPRREAVCGIELVGDLDQPAGGRELREPRPQRLRVSSPAPSAPERTSSTTSVAVGPDRVARGHEGVALAHLGVGARRAAPSGDAAAHVDGLGRRRPARARAAPRRAATCSLSRRAAERRHRDAVLDALRERRRGGLGRDAGARASAPRP